MVLVELSADNSTELRDRTASPWFTARNKADLALHRLLGDRWMPLYTIPGAGPRARGDRRRGQVRFW
ncbi:hypothetical protein ACOBQX_28695 [Actinokineospora sp. G85]|uniref:hypothetical protein n=1 Tax=Actinokineospora sp. G85 TaxID=3406626 RepID=UPI003C752DD7